MQTHAQKEIEILVKTVKEPIVFDYIPEILKIVDKFNSVKHDPSAVKINAKVISATINRLLLAEPLCPITGNEEEWYEYETGKYQNTRCSTILKEGKEGKPFVINAVTWKDQNGAIWNGSAKLTKDQWFQSKWYIKEFPYKYKTFTIDVENKEVKDSFELTIKNKKQLEQVYKIYESM